MRMMIRYTCLLCLLAAALTAGADAQTLVGFASHRPMAAFPHLSESSRCRAFHLCCVRRMVISSRGPTTVSGRSRTHRTMSCASTESIRTSGRRRAARVRSRCAPLLR